MTESELKEELERAYRCIRGFFTFANRGDLPDKMMIAYHSPTIGAACRYVSTGSLDGARYFIGKPVEVLHNALDPKRVQ